jgi:hypothetical protein
LLFFYFLLQDPCWDKTDIKEELKAEVSVEGDEERVDRLVHTDVSRQVSACGRMCQIPHS